ncbi:hypothetical protein L211DRAFT_853535 [Terfezia boudieri ATCC MYA-4762]|uniref:Uncharacterized protein n=1 Tax=Terfezia boudieri ATCC MYA-4762 TaxID=1051890 RepID=A0A3N4L841_9PEZI|nr:hypothetical protein L211DRAFT_853535 [Terfezia boudieri ATCC MYA-4762]
MGVLMPLCQLMGVRTTSLQFMGVLMTSLQLMGIRMTFLQPMAPGRPPFSNGIRKTTLNLWRPDDVPSAYGARILGDASAASQTSYCAVRRHWLCPFWVASSSAHAIGIQP